MGIINTIEQKEKKTIVEEDLQRFASDIEYFVDAYLKNLYITNDKEDDAFDKLNELRNIVKMIRRKRYDELFDPSIEIIFNNELYQGLPF